jgi:hypothetical protein
LTTDEIMVVFEVAESPGMVQEVSEEWVGFRELRGPLEERFGLSPDWFGQVMHPAFAPNYRVLYDPTTTRS